MRVRVRMRSHMPGRIKAARVKLLTNLRADNYLDQVYKYIFKCVLWHYKHLLRETVVP